MRSRAGIPSRSVTSSTMLLCRGRSTPRSGTATEAYEALTKPSSTSTRGRIGAKTFITWSFFNDVSGGNLRAVSWITPTCRTPITPDASRTPAHPGSRNWLMQLGNRSIGTTAIFIFWDDYGSWYDSSRRRTQDYDGLGFRIPLLVISPYAKKGYVSHTRPVRTREHFEVRRGCLPVWHDWPPTGGQIRRRGVASTSQSRRSVPIQSPYDRAYFMHPADRSPDPRRGIR